MRAVLRSAALRVVVLAMILRALVPQGWMLDAQASAHGAALMPCPGVMQADMPARDMDAMAAAHAAHDMDAMAGMARGMPAMAHMAMAAMPGMAAMHHDMMAMPAAHHHAPAHKADSGAPCIFTATAQLGSPMADVAAFPPLPAGVTAAFAAAHDAPASNTVHRPNAARAPPLPA